MPKNQSKTDPMKILEIVANVGILPIKLGMKSVEIQQSMADRNFELSASAHKMDYYADNAIQVEFGSNDEAQFIGISSSNALKVIYLGMEVFCEPAKKVFDHIQKHETQNTDKFNGEEHIFYDQVITLWDADTQYNYCGGRFKVWGQIGIGNQEYLDAIAEFN